MTTRRNQRKDGSRSRKAELLQLRLSAEEKQTFEDAADLSGLALSAWVRERLRKVAMQELNEAGIPVAFRQEKPTNEARE